MDNMDGAAATVGSVTALAAAALALIEGDVALAALCVGLCGRLRSGSCATTSPRRPASSWATAAA